MSKLNFINLLLIITYFTTGCSSPSEKILYENPQHGITLERLSNWDLKFYERSGTIVLSTEVGIFHKEKTRIEILAPDCPEYSSDTPTTNESSSDRLVQEINRVTKLYNLSSVSIVKNPFAIESKDYDISKAVIMIPTTSLPDNSVENQIGKQGPDFFQTIELFALRDKNNEFVISIIYTGNNQALNTQAEQIIGSIRRTCE